MLDGERLRALSSELDIKLSTCKFIWKVFKTEGRVFTKKRQKIDSETSLEIERLRTRLLEVREKKPVGREVVFCPVAVPVFYEPILPVQL